MALENISKVPFTYQNESFHTWYKVVGNLQSGVRPLVVLHGGPGISHHYMLPHEVLAESHKIPVIFYDQFGVGASSHSMNKAETFWSMDLFMSELDNLLVHLDVHGDFDLLGHSWGGYLAGNYAAVRRPAGLKHLIIASSSASMELWLQGTNKLLDAFPEQVKDTIRECEREGRTHSKEYKDSLQAFNQKHVCKLSPWPSLLLKSFEIGDKDTTAHDVMIGPNEFDRIGTLRSWSIVDEIVNIAAPILLINSFDDEAQDVGLMPYFLNASSPVKWAQLAHSAHMPFYEESARYFEILGEFLTSA